MNYTSNAALMESGEEGVTMVSSEGTSPPLALLQIRRGSPALPSKIQEGEERFPPGGGGLPNPDFTVFVLVYHRSIARRLPTAVCGSIYSCF